MEDFKRYLNQFDNDELAILPSLESVIINGKRYTISAYPYNGGIIIFLYCREDAMYLVSDGRVISRIAIDTPIKKFMITHCDVMDGSVKGATINVICDDDKMLISRLMSRRGNKREPSIVDTDVVDCKFVRWWNGLTAKIHINSSGSLFNYDYSLGRLLNMNEFIRINGNCVVTTNSIIVISGYREAKSILSDIPIIDGVKVNDDILVIGQDRAIYRLVDEMAVKVNVNPDVKVKRIVGMYYCIIQDSNDNLYMVNYAKDSNCLELTPVDSRIKM